MDTWDVIWTIYFIVAGSAMIMTYREQIRSRHRVLIYRVAGFLACAAWPVVFPVIAVMASVRA